jgi:hypothetical protein
MRSKFFSLNKRDFIKGLIVAVITGVLTFMVDGLKSGVPLDLAFLGQIGINALIALGSYLLKNLFTNSKGEILTPDSK